MSEQPCPDFLFEPDAPGINCLQNAKQSVRGTNRIMHEHSHNTKVRFPSASTFPILSVLVYAERFISKPTEWKEIESDARTYCIILFKQLF
jgi:hypothetical protein